MFIIAIKLGNGWLNKMHILCHDCRGARNGKKKKEESSKKSVTENGYDEDDEENGCNRL
jgi:hypothetical protein